MVVLENDVIIKKKDTEQEKGFITSRFVCNEEFSFLLRSF